MVPRGKRIRKVAYTLVVNKSNNVLEEIVGLRWIGVRL